MNGMQTSGGAPSSSAAAFLGTWIVMTVAMMLPSIAPTLWRYRQGLARRNATRATWLALAAGAGYFAVWIVIGLALYPLDVALASAEHALPVLARVVPVAAGVIVLLAALVQFTQWKTRQLDRCRADGEPHHPEQASLIGAWRHGLCLGWHCSLSCAGPMASLLAICMMDLRAMGIVTAAITLERLAPAPQRIARIIGIGGVAVGMLMLA